MTIRRIGRWLAGPTALAFCSRAGALLLALSLVSLTGMFRDIVQSPLVLLNAALTHNILKLLGVATRLSGRFVEARSPRFSIEVIPECTGVFLMIILVALTAAFPVRWGAKAMGIAGGLILIFTLNQLRLVTLFLLGQKYPQFFEEAHVFIWQGAFILILSFYWYAWAWRASLRRLPPPQAELEAPA